GLFRLIDSIKAFPLIFILTDGGPGNLTEVTNYYSYLQAFNFSYLGFSSAITIVLLAPTIVLSWVIVRMVGCGARVDEGVRPGARRRPLPEVRPAGPRLEGWTPRLAVAHPSRRTPPACSSG